MIKHPPVCMNEQQRKDQKLHGYRGEHCTCHLVKSITRMIFKLPGRLCTEEDTWAGLI